MSRLTERRSDGSIIVGNAYLFTPNKLWFSIADKLAHYEDLEEQGRLVEIIRCKDCIHLVKTEEGEYNPTDCVCEYWATDGLDENDFCSYAKLAELKGGK